MAAFFLPSSQSQYVTLPSRNFNGIFVADSNRISFLQKNPRQLVEKLDGMPAVSSVELLLVSGSIFLAGLRRVPGMIEYWQKPLPEIRIRQNNKILRASFTTNKALL